MSNLTSSDEASTITSPSSQDFLKPYLKPYAGGVAKYDKGISKAISQSYCAGQCSLSYSVKEMDLIAAQVGSNENCWPLYFSHILNTSFHNVHNLSVFGVFFSHFETCFEFFF